MKTEIPKAKSAWQQSLHDLKNDKSIVIICGDKGSAVIVSDRDYIKEAEK